MNRVDVSTKEFLKHVLNPTGNEKFYIASIDKDKKFEPYTVENIDLIIQWMEENQNKNLHFGVSTRKKDSQDFTKQSCKSLNAFFLDIDFKVKGNSNPEEVLKRIEKFSLIPNIIVFTGNGLHLYWILSKSIEIDKFKLILIEIIEKDLCNALNGDLGASQAANLLRLPNSTNWKDPNNPKSCFIISFDISFKYKIDDFLPDNSNISIVSSEDKLVEEQEITDELIYNKLSTLSSKFCKKLQKQTKSDGSQTDRSRYEFGLITYLLKQNWTPNEICHLAWMPEFKEGIGKKTQEENRPDYLEHTIQGAYNKLIKEGFVFERDKPDFISTISSQVDRNFLEQVYIYQGKFFYYINENSCRCLSADELNKRLKIEFYESFDEAGIKRDSRISNFLQKLNEKRVISEFVNKVTPKSDNRIICQKLPDGTFLVTQINSLLNHLNNLLIKYEGIELSVKVKNFIVLEYPEIIDVFKACLYRKFCGNKKSRLWFHCISNYGKTFFFNIEGVSLVFNHEFDDDKIKGNEPQELTNYVLIFIDEVTRFQKELKNDMVPYRVLYGGTRKFVLPFVVLASANPIGDLEGGIDEQIANRVTKIAPKDLILRENLLKIEETPQSFKPKYEKFIIELLIKETEALAMKANYLVVAEMKFEEFLDKYKKNLQTINFKQLLMQVMQDILNELRTFDNSRNLTGFNREGLIENKFLEFNIITKKLFLIKPNEFLQKFFYPRIGNKRFGFERAIPNNERLAEALGSLYQSNNVGYAKIKSIELFYQLANDVIILLDRRPSN